VQLRFVSIAKLLYPQIFLSHFRPFAYTNNDGKNRQNDKRKNEKMDKDQNGMPIYPEQEGCAAHPELAEGVQLAMVYAPKQAFRMLYTAPDALKHGTLFEELYKPLEEV
jgi:hypothetical protein